VGELHYEALVKKQKAHAAASHHLEREVERLNLQIEDLHAKGREADNALELMRSNAIARTSEIKDSEAMLLLLLMLKTLTMNSTTRKRSEE
ncbi:hypothetical protein MKW92_000482, partial [Papaver armeniacum]